jgi:hypothetical protein
VELHAGFFKFVSNTPCCVAGMLCRCSTLPQQVMTHALGHQAAAQLGDELHIIIAWWFDARHVIVLRSFCSSTSCTDSWWVLQHPPTPAADGQPRLHTTGGRVACAVCAWQVLFFSLRASNKSLNIWASGLLNDIRPRMACLCGAV